MHYRERQIPPGFYEQPVGKSTAELILDTVNLRSTSETSSIRVLDFGCGTGRYLEVFAARVPKQNIVGIEVNQGRILEARDRGFPVILVSPNTAVLPFSDEVFDVVFSSNVIEHIPPRLYRTYLKEIHRVLKPGGRFAVGAPNYPIKRFYDMITAWRVSQYRWYYLFDDPTHCNKQSVLTVEKHLKSLFRNVCLKPSYLLFQEKIPLLRKEKVRYALRGFGYKFFGACIK